MQAGSRLLGLLLADIPRIDRSHIPVSGISVAVTFVAFLPSYLLI